MCEAITIETAVEGVQLRASRDQRGCLFLACIHTATDTVLTIVALAPGAVRPVANHSLIFGKTMIRLAQAEPDKLMAWIRESFQTEAST